MDWMQYCVGFRDNLFKINLSGVLGLTLLGQGSGGTHFNPSTEEAEREASLVYRECSRTAKATLLDPVSKQQTDRQTKMDCSWEKKIGLQIMTDNGFYF